MKAGDLVKLRGKTHIVTKTYGVMVTLSEKPQNQLFKVKDLEVINGVS